MVDSLGITSTSRHRYNWENFGNEEGQALNHAIQISGVRQALHNNVPRIRRIKQQESSSLTTEEIYLPILPESKDLNVGRILRLDLGMRRKR